MEAAKGFANLRAGRACVLACLKACVLMSFANYGLVIKK